MVISDVQIGREYAVFVDGKVCCAEVDGIYEDSVSVLYEDRPFVHSAELDIERVLEPWMEYLHGEALRLDEKRTEALLESASGWVGGPVDTGRATVDVADLLRARIAALEARVKELEATA